ncbi:FAD-binding oxidoreductase [Cereibacter sphaeroides]|nr:FAD-binding oxidoreductase [Cereibacter sphaeroides]
MKASDNVEVAVIGGGLVGAAIAYGLRKRGLRIAVLDEGDSAFRASRGNFGLVCAGGKGGQLEDYAPWALQGVQVWKDFADRLVAETGIDIELEQNGLSVFCPDADSLRERIALMERLQRRSGLAYDVLTPAEIERFMPGVSLDVPGALHCDIDGAANPMLLLRALHASLLSDDGILRRGGRVERIERLGDGYRVVNAEGTTTCGRVVLAAGLGNIALGQNLGVSLPIKPMRGQILVTERCPPRMRIPSEHVRQTRDGSYLLGGSWEDVGFDTGTTAEVTQAIARRAVSYFPFLRHVRLVRSWSALRILAPDNAPIYDEIAPGAFLVTCHSGVSLAAIHAAKVAGWIAEGALPQEAAPFSLRRFDAPRQEAVPSRSG